MADDRLSIPSRPDGSDERPIPADATLTSVFSYLASLWHEDTSVESSITKIAAHPASAAITRIGPSMVPYILDDLRYHGGYWFPALRELTGENPVVPAERESDAEPEPATDAPLPSTLVLPPDEQEDPPLLGTLPTLSDASRSTAKRRPKPAPAPTLNPAEAIAKESVRDATRRAAEHVREQHLRVDGHEARLRERMPHREWGRSRSAHLERQRMGSVR